MVEFITMMSVFVLGMSFALLGSISEQIIPRLHIKKEQFGNLISIFMLSCLFSSLLTGAISQKTGFKGIVVIGLISTGLTLLLLARSKNYPTAIISCILLGMGAMAMNTTGNSMAPQLFFGGNNPAAAGNLTNVFFGLGLFLTPLFISFVSQKLNYKVALSLLSGVIFISAVIALFTKGYPLGNLEINQKINLTSSRNLLKESTIWIAGVILFCYMALETSFCNWLPLLGNELTDNKRKSRSGKKDSFGPQLISLFALAMMIGRLLLSFFTTKIGFDLTANGEYTVMISAGLSTIIVFLITTCQKRKTMYILAPLAGFFFAPCFPTTVGVTLSQFSPNQYGNVYSIIFAIGLSGSVIIPKIIGLPHQQKSIRAKFRILLPLSLVLAILPILLTGK